MQQNDNARREKRRMLMLNEPVHKVIPRMAVPTIISFLITSIYNLADTYFVSSLGTNATAAVSVNGSLDQLIMMCGSMLAVGATSYIARLMGQGNDHKASQVLSTAFFTAFAFGTILAVFGTIFMLPMVRLLGATLTCEQYSVEYATYVLLAAPFMASSFVMNHCLRGEGSATLSMVGMSFGGILNCILDPIFIFGLDMGVAGASLATAISKFVSFCILIFPYLTHRSMLYLSWRNILYNRDIIGNVVSVGSSSMFRSGLAVVSAILLNDIAGNISDSVLAAVGVCNKVMMFPFGIILGFGNGFQPVAGFNWGAKRFDRVQQSYGFSSRTALIGAAIMAALLILFADPLIVAFAGTDPEMREIGRLCMILQCIALPLHAWVTVVNMLCSSLGNARGAFILAIARQGTCFLPILFPLTTFFGVYGVASVQAIADVLSMIFAVPLAIVMKKRIAAAREAHERECIANSVQ